MDKMWLLTVVLVAFLLTIYSCSKDKSTEPNNPTVPVLTTAAISEITDATAECGGTISSDGGAAVNFRGVCWSSDSIPTYSDLKTYDGTGTGTFTSSITGLTAMTRYYVRAYAMNDAGLGYGVVDSFTTSDSMGMVTDIDGNTYPTIKIGNQWWMAENLKVTHYRDGESIPNLTDSIAWESDTTGAYCFYENDTARVISYGMLYNWLAVSNSRNMAPAGWHVPSDSEWKQLEMQLGLSQAEADSTGWRGTDEGGKMKETGTAHWDSPNTGATNESGFTGLPGGLRFHQGGFNGMGFYASFWSTTEFSSDIAWTHSLVNGQARVSRDGDLKGNGFSVRCIKD